MYKDVMKEIVNSFHYSCESVKNEMEERESTAVSSRNLVEQDAISDLLYRKLEYDINYAVYTNEATEYFI